MALPEKSSTERHPLGFSQAAEWADAIESNGARLAGLINRTPAFYPRAVEQRIRSIYAELSDLTEEIETESYGLPKPPETAPTAPAEVEDLRPKFSRTTFSHATP